MSKAPKTTLLQQRTQIPTEHRPPCLSPRASAAPPLCVPSVAPPCRAPPLLCLPTPTLLFPDEHDASPSQIQRSQARSSLNPAAAGEEELRSVTPSSVACLRPRRAPSAFVVVERCRSPPTPPCGHRAHHYKGISFASSSQEDAFLPLDSFRTQNRSSVWVICWEAFLGRQSTVESLFWV